MRLVWTTIYVLGIHIVLYSFVYHVTAESDHVTQAGDDEEEVTSMPENVNSSKLPSPPPKRKAKKPKLDRFSTEKELAQSLLLIYKDIGSHGRPVKNYMVPIIVKVALHLVQILDIDEHNQVLTTSIRTSFIWQDEFLIWNAEDYGGVKVVGMSPKEIWVPDIILSNSVAEEKSLSSARFPLAQVAEEEEIDKYAIVKVHCNGTIEWSQRKVYRTSCIIDMANYPFDSQQCSMIVKSSSYNSKELDIVSLYEEDTNLVEAEDHHILREYIESPEWDVIEVRMYEDLRDTTPADTMRYVLVLRRKLVFFTYILLMPCLFLTILTLVIFWLPPERPDKTTLGVYYFFNMVISALSIILATTVVNISRSGRNKPRVPKWLKSIAIDTLGGMFGVTGGRVSTIAERLIMKEELKKQEKTLRKHALKGSSSVTVYKPGEGSSILIASQKVAKAHNAELPEHQTSRQLSETSKRHSRENQGPLGSRQRTSVTSPSSVPSSLDREGSDSDDLVKVEAGISDNDTGAALLRETKIAIDDSECLETLSRMERFIMEIRSYIKEMAEFNQTKTKRMDFRDEKAQEWHAVAVALDRTFFFLYLAMLFILAIVSSAILFPRTF